MRKLAFIILAAIPVFFCNCKKETVTRVDTIIQHDTVYMQVHDTTTIPALISDTTTTLIIVRHAEKEATGTDPNLTADGQLRAEELKRVLGNIPVQAIYTTPYNRTRQTVQPLAAAKGITVAEYATSKPYAQLISEIKAANRGKVVVIVGHSNTVPDLLKTISNNTFAITITDSQYDDLFIAALPDNLSATISQLKYGKETP